jgi:segregation and condensation protein A
MSETVQNGGQTGQIGFEALQDPSLGGPYAVSLPIFEGPLDLLLHLIRLNEVDVTDIPIARIAEQYVETIELMQEINLDVAGEYLLMAATLAWIKSRLILPSVESEEDDEGDPRADLVARLLEYQRFKEAAEALGERQRLGRDVFESRGSEPEPTRDEEREIEVGLVALLDAFRAVVRSAKGQAIHEIEAETITVRERMIAVMDLVESLASLEFAQVFEREGGAPPSRALLVTTFLAILELVRLSAIRVYQSAGEDGVPTGPIHLRRVGDGDRAWRGRVADVM